MGCWNETCGITQMPIEGGDKVRMFLIVENKWAGEDVSYYYNTDLWKPFGLPIKGTYDTYGRIENIEEDALTDLLLESLKEMIVEVPNRMGEVFKREDLNWTTVIDFLTDEGLKVTDPYHISFINKKLNEVLEKVKAEFPDLPDNGWSSERSNMADEQKKIVSEDKNIVRMYHMMVHEDVYQALAKGYKAPENRFSSWTDGNLRTKLQEDAIKFVDNVRKNLDEAANLSENVKSLHKNLLKMSYEFDLSNRFISSANYLTGTSGSGEYMRKYLDFVEKSLKNPNSETDLQIKNLTDQFIDFLCFNQCMALLRKMWMPQTGKGGQDREFILHKFLGETIKSFSEKKLKDYQDMYGENDIEEENESSE